MFTKLTITALESPGVGWIANHTVENEKVLIRDDIIKQHDNVKNCLEYSVPIEHKDNNTGEPTGVDRLWVHLVAHQYNDGQWFLEGRLANDSVDDVVGYRKLQVFIAINDAVIVETSKLQQEGRHVDLFDMTSFCFTYGKPQWSPKAGAQLEKYVPLPPIDKVDLQAVQWSVNGPWGQPNKKGEDKWWSSGGVGSPRMGYLSRFFAAHRYCPNKHEPANTLLHWVYEQLGMMYDGEHGKKNFKAGRPYHLYKYEEGKRPQPFKRGPEFETDGPALFTIGSLDTRRNETWPEGQGCTTFGREKLPVVDVREVGWDEDAWIGCRVKGFSNHSGRDLITSKGFNSWDPEHFATRYEYAACLLTSSVFAKNQFTGLMESFRLPDGPHQKTYGVPFSWTYCSRTVGWVTQAILSYAHAMDSQEYYLFGTGIRKAMLERRHNGLLPSYWPRLTPVVLTRGPSRGENTWYVKEACWKAATFANACIMGEGLYGDASAKEEWRALGVEAASVAAECWTPQGMYENIFVKRVNEEGDAEVELEGRVSKTGTRRWCFPAAAYDANEDWTKAFWHYLTMEQTGRNDHDGRPYGDEDMVTWRWALEARLRFGPSQKERTI